MALSAGMVWEVRTGGDDVNNGGGFRGGAVIPPPAGAPTVAGSSSGGTVAAGTYYCVVTYQDAQGETTVSPEASVTLTGATSSFTVTSPAQPTGGTVWNLYVGTTSGGPYFPQGSGLSFGANRSVTATPPTTGTGPPGTDYSQQTSAQLAVNNTTVTATTAGANSNVITFSGYTPTKADVGNTFVPTAGTNINLNVPYEIVNFTSNSWTVQGASNLTTAAGAGSAIVGRMGGAFASCGRAAGFAVSGNLIFRKYNASSEVMGSSSNVAGGRVSVSVSVAVVSYDANRTINNTDANRQVFEPGANGVTCFSLSGSNSLAANLAFSNPNAYTTATAVTLGGILSDARRCRFSGAWTTGLSLAVATTVATECEGSSFLSGTLFAVSGNGSVLAFCTSDACTGVDIQANVSGLAVLLFNTISNKATGTAINVTTITSVYALGNTIHMAGSSVQPPFSLANLGRLAFLTNNLAWGNASNSYPVYGWNNNTSTTRFWGPQILNCAGGNGGSAGNYPTNLPADAVRSFVALTVNPFNNAASRDLSLNNTAGGGAALRGQGFPQTYPGTSTTSRPDVGASQHAESTSPRMNRGIRSGGSL